MMEQDASIEIYDTFLSNDDIVVIKEFINHEINTSSLPLLTAYFKKRLVGFLTYLPDDIGYQIISFYINPLLKKQHIGSTLMYHFVEKIGLDRPVYGFCKIGSSGFYEAIGFDLEYDEIFQSDVFCVDNASKIRKRLKERYDFE